MPYFAFGESSFHVFLAAAALLALRRSGFGAWRTVAAAVGAVKVAQEAAVAVAAFLVGRPLEHPGETAAWAIAGAALVAMAAVRRPVRVRVRAEE